MVETKTHKTCSKCSQIKEVHLFAKGRNRCLDCYSKYIKQFRADKAAGISRTRVKLEVSHRICKDCSQDKEISLFRRGRLVCKECYKKTILKALEKKKEEFLLLGAPKDKYRECRTCKEEKSLDNFYLTGYRCNQCKESKPQRLIEKEQARKQEYLDSRNEPKACRLCNEVKLVSDFRIKSRICKKCKWENIKAERLRQNPPKLKQENFGVNSLGEKEKIKICIRCQKAKFEGEFVSRTKTSKKTYCKDCNNEKSRKKYVKAQKEKGLKVTGTFGHVKFTEFEAKYRNNESARRSRNANLEQRRAECRKYKKENRHKFNAYNRKRYYTDPAYNMEQKIRRRIHMAIKAGGETKSEKTRHLLGCDSQTLKAHLISKLENGMTWEKIIDAEIEIDHIIPCSLFDMSDIEEQRRCFNYKNLTPLWANDNYTKGDLYMGIRWRFIPKTIKKIIPLIQMVEELYNIE